MEGFESRGMGWQRDLADGRDYHPDHPVIRALWRQSSRSATRARRMPPFMDLREYLPVAEDQGTLNASTAFAALSLIAYFEVRSSGHTLDASRLFLCQMALKLLHLKGKANVDLRTTFKALVRFGAPPEHYWPYDVEHFQLDPTDAFLFSHARDFESIRYLRLDTLDGEKTLRRVKEYLAAGFVLAFGFSVPSSLTADADIGYRPKFDAIRGGQAVLAVGYDDHRRIGSDTGALLFRNSWGAGWGEKGYGWLPYSYVTDHMAVDFWTALRPSWLDAGYLCKPLADVFR